MILRPLLLLIITWAAPLLAQAAGRDFSIRDYGAVGDGTTLDTAAIQAAIDAAQAADQGGRVVIPAGTFRSGALFLKAGVELHLEADAVLLGSADIADYPKRRTRVEGHFPEWRVALINASEIDGLRITGDGTIDGNGRVYWEAFWTRRRANPRCTNLEVERPRLLFIDRCTDVVVRGVRLKDSGFWNLHLYNCRDVLVENVSIAAAGPEAKIRAPSSDGIDIDSCQDVTIRGCTFAVDDDCIALKGTKGPLADQDAASPPVERILIEDCTFLRGHGVLTCGSEATLVRDVTVRGCTIRGDVAVVRLKLRPDTPQHYSNLVFENLTLDGHGRLFEVNPWTQFFDLQGHAPPPSRVDGVVVRNVSGHYGQPGRIVPNEGDSLAPFVLENVNLTFDRPAFERGPGVAIVARQSTFNGEVIAP